MTDALRSYVAGELHESSTFYELSSRCRGALPSTVMEALEQIAYDDRGLRTKTSKLIADAKVQPSDKPYADPALPLAHPLDYEWRFGEYSAEMLLRNAIDALGVNSTLLLVCTPTILRVAARKTHLCNIVYASRSNDPVTRSLQTLFEEVKFVDIRDDLRGLNANAAILDPPWYDDIAVPMLSKAFCGTLSGSQILLCVPDALTACSSAEILSDPTNLKRHFDGGPIHELPFRIRYETPLFEINALNSVGVTNFHPRWRTGRVFSLRAGRRQRDMDVPSHNCWQEVSLGRTRIRIRGGAGSCRPGQLSGPLEFSILNSVSRADRERLGIALLSTGNRFARPEVVHLTGRRQRTSIASCDLEALGVMEDLEAETKLRSSTPPAQSLVDENLEIVDS